MKYLPFENIIYRTKLELEEIQKRLNEVIEPQKTFRMTGVWGNNDHKPYEGSINENSFSMTRIPGYRNSFLPKINGILEKDVKGTKITVKMTLHTFVIVFITIWCGGLGIACLVFLPMLLSSQHFEPAALIPFGMLIFGYVLVTVGFKYESTKSKRFLTELFEAKIEQ